MESTKRALKFQLNYSKASILKFGAVVLILDIFALFISKYTSATMGISQSGGEELFSLFGVNILPLIVYLIVCNYDSYYKQFPIALSFSMIRKDFFKSMILNNILIAFIFAVIQSLLMKVDPIIVRFIGKVPTYDFKVFNMQTNSMIFIMVYFFIAFLLFMTMWNLIAILNYKFGARMWIVLGALSVITSTTIKINLFDLIFPGDWLNIRMDILQFIILLGIILLLYLPIYFITLNTNIKNKA